MLARDTIIIGTIHDLADDAENVYMTIFDQPYAKAELKFLTSMTTFLYGKRP